MAGGCRRLDPELDACLADPKPDPEIKDHGEEGDDRCKIRHENLSGVDMGDPGKV
jgi:hypothetical protein